METEDLGFRGGPAFNEGRVRQIEETVNAAKLIGQTQALDLERMLRPVIIVEVLVRVEKSGPQTGTP
jgi:hypothetical protein